MNRFIVSILFLSLVTGAHSQVFVSNQATLHVGSDALLYVSQNDIENEGSLFLSGEIDLNGNFINSGLWEASNAQSSLFSLTGTWTNDGTTDPGQGKVVFKGNVQQISGSNVSSFYDLELQGNLVDEKVLNQDIIVGNSLNLNNSVLNVGPQTVQLLNQNEPILSTGGFIETGFAGRVDLQFTGSLPQAYIIPFGFNSASPTTRNLAANRPLAGNYAFALIAGDPGINGMSGLSLQDSVCRIHPDYYWYVESDQIIDIGLETDASEYVFSRLSEWNGSLWSQIPSSTLSPPVVFQHKSLSLQSGDSKFIALSSEAPFVDLEADFVVFKNIKRTISLTGYIPTGSDILWTPPDQLVCDDCVPATIIPKVSQMYRLTVSNDVCQSEDQILITVLDQPDVFIQNAFSPNSDNLNELFYPQLAAYETFIAMRIYDRWGGKLYEGDAGWDGTSQNSPVPAGMYLYEIEYRREYSPTDIRTKYARGTVMVVR